MNDEGMRSFAMQFCKDVCAHGEAQKAFEIVWRGVDGYIAKHEPKKDEKKLIESAVYFVVEAELHKKSFEEVGGMEDKAVAVIEHLESAYGVRNP